MAIRIGIDVGGTFTDAVAINDENYELVGKVKIPTTHTAKEGVAAGIIECLHRVMEENNITPDQVSFIAHGTTQATNALLEGDVDVVGILTMGKGIEGAKAKSDTNIGDVALSEGKSIQTNNHYVAVSDNPDDFIRLIDEGIEQLKADGSTSIVATEAFSVDNPENENLVVSECAKLDVPGTATNEISKLYGLKVRTRTAVINASILPKMIKVANMTEESIKKAYIKAPLMVMRCDGGVMTIDEVRNRPIMTILSGPAAGVAGALMYEKLTDGIFLEVGGTSTDISCVRDGNVVIRYAEVGGHKTYLNSLDVRTVGIGGGSMIKLHEGKAVDVGPRSAHIANLEYEVYTNPENITDPVLKSVRPLPTDAEYAYIECSDGKKYALTLSGAANIAGYVGESDYAKGNAEAARKAWKPLAENMGMSVEEAAMQVLDYAAKKNGAVVQSFIDDYKLSVNTLSFVGGGGGASVVVPHLAEKFGTKHKIANNAPVISPIGVALAMVREVIERTVYHATKEDVVAVRNEAFNKAVSSGAAPETVEVTVNVNARENRVTAIATGATEMRSKDLSLKPKDADELSEIVAENLNVDKSELKLEAENENYCAFICETVTKTMLFFNKKQKTVRLIDRNGVIRLQRKNANINTAKGSSFTRLVQYCINEYARAGEGGMEMPNIYIATANRLIPFEGMQTAEQIMALANVESAGVASDEILIAVTTRTTDNERG